VGVWHPNLAPPLGFPDAPAAFRRLLDRLLALQPFVGTLGTITEWRAARRSIRVRRLAPDGRIDAYATASTASPLSLEDPGGRLLTFISSTRPPPYNTPATPR
jgi:hypothetical protein